jgi:hypothetical protein
MQTTQTVTAGELRAAVARAQIKLYRLAPLVGMDPGRLGRYLGEKLPMPERSGRTHSRGDRPGGGPLMLGRAAARRWIAPLGPALGAAIRDRRGVAAQRWSPGGRLGDGAAEGVRMPA